MGIRTRLVAAMMAAAMSTAAVAATTAASAAPASLTAPGGDQQSDKKVRPDKPSGVPEEAVKLLAAELHISADRARRVFKDLEKVEGRGADIVKDKAFIGIARRLGITPQRLLDALIKVKQELAGKEKKPSDAPTK